MRVFSTCTLALFSVGTLSLSAVSPPKVHLEKNLAAKELTDTTGAKVAFSPPARRLIDMNLTLPAYLAISQNVNHLVAVRKTALQQAKYLGMDSRFPSLQHVPTVDYSASPEQLMAYRPDAILSQGRYVDLLRSLGVPSVFGLALDLNYKPSTKVAAWTLLGKVVQEESRARSLTDSYRSNYSGVERRDDTSISVAVLFGGSGFWAIAGEKYYLNGILKASGATNKAAGYARYPRVDLEQLLVLDPEVIFLNSQPDDAIFPEDLYQRAGWKTLRAVRDGKVYKLPKVAAFLGPAEEPLLIRWMNEILHPDAEKNFRAEYSKSFSMAYRYEPSDDEIDRVIFLTENSGSVGYYRFLHPGGAPDGSHDNGG